MATSTVNQLFSGGHSSAEESLQHCHWFKQLLEQSVEATLIWYDHRLVFCNPAAATLLGYDD